VPLLRRIPTRWLLPAAGLAFAIPSVVVATVAENRLRAGRQPDAWGDAFDVAGLFRHLFWTGGYPLVGWTGFVLVGLWVARRRLPVRRVQVRMLTGAALVALAQPILAVLDGSAGWTAALFDGVSHSNRLAWYVLSSATAVGVLALCLLATAAQVPRWRTSFARLGQCALSAYLAHLAIGELWVWEWRIEDHPVMPAQLVVAGAVIAGLTMLATLWRARFARGPIEAALRWASG
jgi:uncharacterized membrane protein YeiB